MRRLVSFCFALAFVLLSVGLLEAASSIALTVSAEVPVSSPELSLLLLQIDDGDPDGNPFTGSTTVTSMTFGPLQHKFADGSEAGIWFAKRFFAAMLFTQPFGLPYNVTGTFAGLLAGANRIPDASFVLTPDYQAADEFSPGNPQGPMPIGASPGTKGSAVGTDKLVYSSELGTATGRIIRAFYSLPPVNADGSLPYVGWSGIPLSQVAGNYSGTLTITITLK